MNEDDPNLIEARAHVAAAVDRMRIEALEALWPFIVSMPPAEATCQISEFEQAMRERRVDVLASIDRALTVAAATEAPYEAQVDG